MQCREWLKKKSERYLSHDNQNKILKIMAMNILHSITRNVQDSEIITVMMDECADITNKE